MARRKGGANKDLFHGQGNQTASLPKHLRGGTKLTDPHTSPGKLIPHRKKTQPGWSK